MFGLQESPDALEWNTRLFTEWLTAQEILQDDAGLLVGPPRGDFGERDGRGGQVACFVVPESGEITDVNDAVLTRSASIAVLGFRRRKRVVNPCIR